jgi:cellulose synthase/poly-beta-1,6-N-acetylglucosamine synthase-like glycosyltransferase
VTSIGLTLIGLPLVLLLYTYVGYPALLRLGGRRNAVPVAADPGEWPLASVSLPAYNEEAVIRQTLEAWLAVDYPTDALQIVVISDASTDGTDEIVEEFEGRGVELVRLKQRRGKTAAENAAAPSLRGEIIINTDAAVRVRPNALKPLVRAFLDPTVGVASGRDVSVGTDSTVDNAGEAGYVGYEMWVRHLETRNGGIIGASGCFYAIRSELHRKPIPEHLSRDFASALTARENGFRAVSVDEAVCLVPRTGSLRAEFRRKARTMARGLETLWYKRHLMNPLRYGRFAFMLMSHKMCRWLVPVTLPLAVGGLALLASEYLAARVLLLAALAGTALGILGLLWPDGKRRPPVLALMAYGVGANLAALLGWLRAVRRRKDAVWEPTRRPGLG